MLSDYLHKTDTRIPVTVHGGPQDGATVLTNNFKPGTRLRLNNTVYVIVWRNGQPRWEQHNA